MRKIDAPIGTEMLLIWLDAGDREGSLAEVKRKGLYRRKAAGRYCGQNRQCFIFCLDYVEEDGDNNQTYTLIPKSCLLEATAWPKTKK